MKEKNYTPLDIAYLALLLFIIGLVIYYNYKK